MGASSGQRDLFIEFNAMKAEPGTTYGAVTDPQGHTHMPTPEMLKSIGDTFAAHGIVAHFDVGDIAAFQGLGVKQRPDWDWIDDYTSTGGRQLTSCPRVWQGRRDHQGSRVRSRGCSPERWRVSFLVIGDGQLEARVPALSRLPGSRRRRRTDLCSN